MRSWFNKVRNNVRNNVHNNGLKFHQKSLTIVLGIFGSYFVYVFSKILVIKPDGVYISQTNSWSDWVVHISITNIFASKSISEWFLYHPFFAYGKLTYGFLVHLITAGFMRMGFSLANAFLAVSIILILLFLTALYFLYFQISESRKESVLGIFLFLTSSGLGIFRYWGKLSLNQILNPVADYSRYPEYDWLAGNIPAAMLIPQRAFLIGVTIGVWALNLLLWGIKEIVENKINTTNLQKKFLFFAGILAGILPVAHMHSFIVILVTSGIICLYTAAKFRPLIRILFIYYVLPSTLISTTLYLAFIHGGIQIDDFMTISLGWTSKGGLIPWVMMWLKLWGTFLPLAILGLYLHRNKIQQPKQIAFFIGFMAVFLLANIIIFQPTKWDNTKLFAWVYLGLSILVAKFLYTLIRTSLKQKILACLLIATLSATGLVELIRITKFETNTNMISTRSEVQLAEKIRQNTVVDAVFLTSTAHNHPVAMWASRPIFLGYMGWVRNFGFDPFERNNQSRLIFSGQLEANQLIRENKISYIFVGPKEESEYQINFQYLNQFPVVFRNENTLVYDVRSLWQ